MTPSQTQPWNRGDIYMATLPKLSGSIQHGSRPVLILQNNIGNKYAPTIIVAPITSQNKRDADSNKPSMPTHVQLANNSLIAYKPKFYWRLWSSVIVIEQIMTLDKVMLTERIGKTDVLPDMEAAIMVALGMEG